MKTDKWKINIYTLCKYECELISNIFFFSSQNGSCPWFTSFMGVLKFSDPVLNWNVYWMLTWLASTERPWLVYINLFHVINIFEFPISTAVFFFASTVECLRDLIFYFLYCLLRHNLSCVVRKIAVHSVYTYEMHAAHSHYNKVLHRMEIVAGDCI